MDYGISVAAKQAAAEGFWYIAALVLGVIGGPAPLW